MELVDVLAPPDFRPTGKIKRVDEAIASGDWLGVANLWLLRPGPALLYQLRPKFGWEPGKLDGSVGGYYRAGESGLDIMREAQEELGWKCAENEVVLLGRHISVGVDSLSRERRLVVSAYMATSDTPLAEFKLDVNEVPAIFEILADDVIRAFKDPNYTFQATGMNCEGERVVRGFSLSDFSYVFGGYHLKVAKIAKIYATGNSDWYY